MTAVGIVDFLGDRVAHEGDRQRRNVGACAVMYARRTDRRMNGPSAGRTMSFQEVCHGKR